VGEKTAWKFKSVSLLHLSGFFGADPHECERALARKLGERHAIDGDVYTGRAPITMENAEGEHGYAMLGLSKASRAI